ncbi:ECF transporter S component [Streptomyces sp. 8N114]|uniref:ECF transporter S component n=1 Tax=Streptomyces sp. 8N114 TaxID=3457419 RepID=UPI003FCFA72F
MASNAVPFNTRTSMTCVAVGAAFGLVLIPANLLANATAALPVLVALCYGLWVLPALVAVALLPRAGAGIMASTVSGLVAGFGSGYGPFMIVMMALWGLLLELPFLITRFRRLGTGMFALSGAVIGVISGLWTAGFLGFNSLSPLVLISMIVAALASSVVFAVASARLAARLRKAGVGTVVHRAPDSPTPGSATEGRS